jgi:hypothetical protein
MSLSVIFGPDGNEATHFVPAGKDLDRISADIGNQHSFRDRLFCDRSSMPLQCPGLGHKRRSGIHDG